MIFTTGYCLSLAVLICPMSASHVAHVQVPDEPGRLVTVENIQAQHARELGIKAAANKGRPGTPNALDLFFKMDCTVRNETKVSNKGKDMSSHTANRHTLKSHTNKHSHTPLSA